MLDKKQAAEYSQVTTRSLERYTNQGRISVRYEQSPNGEIAMFGSSQDNGKKVRLTLEDIDFRGFEEH